MPSLFRSPSRKEWRPGEPAEQELLESEDAAPLAEEVAPIHPPMITPTIPGLSSSAEAEETEPDFDEHLYGARPLSNKGSEPGRKAL